MPWPATHVLIAEKCYAPFFSHLNHSDFIIGNCFPDIRYPAGIERDRTHINHASLTQIQTCTAFRAGVLFHNLVDILWNTYIRQNEAKLFTVIPHDRPMFHTMKILQDHFLYHEILDWKNIAAYFNAILPEEQEYGIGKTMIQQWHAMLKAYFGKPLDKSDLRMLSQTLPEELVRDIANYYDKFRENEILNMIMCAFYQDFELIMDQQMPNGSGLH